MSNNANDLFDFTWDPISEKLLICKDDPTIDIEQLKSISPCTVFQEIIYTATQPESSINLYDMIHLNISRAYAIKENTNVAEKYRIFKVDQVKQFVYWQDYFVGVLQFTQASFENLMLYNYLSENLDELERITLKDLKCFDAELIETETEIDDLLESFEDILRKKIIQNLQAATIAFSDFYC
jgi:hypothetical protein